MVGEHQGVCCKVYKLHLAPTRHPIAALNHCSYRPSGDDVLANTLKASSQLFSRHQLTFDKVRAPSATVDTAPLTTFCRGSNVKGLESEADVAAAISNWRYSPTQGICRNEDGKCTKTCST
jgi:hypothetical protein